VPIDLGVIPFFLGEVIHDPRIEALGFSLPVETDERRTTAVHVAGFVMQEVVRGLPLMSTVWARAGLEGDAGHGAGDVIVIGDVMFRQLCTLIAYTLIGLPAYAASFSLGLSPARTANRTNKSMLNRLILPRLMASVAGRGPVVDH
jgi:hypothetical protein